MDSLVIKEFGIEKKFIKKPLRLLNTAMERTKKTEIELTAMGAFLHDIYNGMENIIKRVFKNNRIMVKNTGSFHKDLLDKATYCIKQ